jgi:hypothetical protein
MTPTPLVQVCLCRSCLLPRHRQRCTLSQSDTLSLAAGPHAVGARALAALTIEATGQERKDAGGGGGSCLTSRQARAQQPSFALRRSRRGGLPTLCARRRARSSSGDGPLPKPARHRGRPRMTDMTDRQTDRQTDSSRPCACVLLSVHGEWVVGCALALSVAAGSSTRSIHRSARGIGTPPHSCLRALSA